MARLADRLVYGSKKELPAPELVSVDGLKDASLTATCSKVLKFKNVVGGLRSVGAPSGFTFVDKHHNDTHGIYKIILTGNTVRLETNLPMPSDVALMYGAGFAPLCNITDGRDMPIPVFGPLDCIKPAHITAYVTDWLVSGILPAERKIDQWESPKSGNFKLEKRTFSGNFNDMHPVWQGKPGQAVFFNQMDLPEDMKLKLCFGYDGPSRIWLDGQSIFVDMAGTNPALPDAKTQTLELKAGRHDLAVAMDLNGGLAWGFFLRFERLGLSKQQLKERSFAMPSFSAQPSA
jgi:hypothetical protein